MNTTITKPSDAVLTPREKWEALRDLKCAAQAAWQAVARREYAAWQEMKEAEKGEEP